MTGHPGSKRLYLQISARYYHSDLRRRIDQLQCEHCQRNKLDGKGYRLLPEREIQTMPFNECAVDLIGLWVVQVNSKLYKFNALTAINTVSNLVELVRIENKTSEHIARLYAQLWLARYPWPECCVHDNGGEFVGPEFQTLMQRCNIKDVTTSAKNPQANAVAGTGQHDDANRSIEQTYGVGTAGNGPYAAAGIIVCTTSLAAACCTHTSLLINTITDNILVLTM